MQLKFPSMKFSVKLPLIIAAFVAVTILVMAAANATINSSIIRASAVNTLKSLAVLKTDAVETFSKNVERDLRLQAETPTTRQALIALSDGFASLEDRENVLRRVYITQNQFPPEARQKLVTADTGSSYGFIHAIYHPHFTALLEEMNYYDIFLIDTRGNLVYSVVKENDFATNLMEGQWKNSGLAKAFRQALTRNPSDPAIFVDFAPYEPSNFAPAAFLARPVHDEAGKPLGVMAYQMPTGILSATVRLLDGFSRTADGFLVGADRLLRTDSLRTDVHDTLETIIDNQVISLGISGQEGVVETSGFDGQQVIGYYRPVDFMGTRWVLMLQEDTAEIFAGVKRSLGLTAIIAGVIFLVVISGSIFLSRRFSGPISSLTAAVSCVAKGKLRTKIPGLARKDEIGELARAAEVFRKNALEMEKLSREQRAANEQMIEMHAEQEKSVEREKALAAEREETDRAIAVEREAMMRTLSESFGEVVEAARAGQFSNRISVDIDDMVLVELANNMNHLMETVDDGLTHTGTILSSIADGDLSRRMEGDFKGAFADLQSHVNNMLDALTFLVGEISESGATLIGSSNELKETADVLSRQAEQNASSVEETSAALEQLSASISHVTGNIEAVSSNAKSAKEIAVSSEIIAVEAATSMDRIADGSKEIARVIEVINEIAFQINLLALNAGVEAARAGDAGLGFSVVASEVRQLSHRASDAAKEIAEVIRKSDEAVTKGVSNVASAKKSLEEIATSVVKISESIEEVSLAVSEQSTGIKGITVAVTHIDSNTQKQAAAFEEVTASSHVLAQEAKDLSAATARFRLKPKDAKSRHTMKVA